MNNGHTDSSGSENGAAKTARQGVAIVGFVLIAIIGMTIAVYAARFVPSAISGMGSAAAYVSSLFAPPAEKPKDETPIVAKTPEVPVLTPAPVATTTPVVSTPPTAPKPVAPAYYGSPDLIARITSVGYCTSRSQYSFVPSSTIPSNAPYGGAQFTFTNVGTNIASNWMFEVETPGNDRTEGYGVMLRPSQSALGVVCYDPVRGENEVTVTADSRDYVFESNERNNSDSRSIDSRGGSSSSNNDLWCDLTASDRSIDEGDTITLRWETEDADEARLNQGIGRVDEDGGSRRVSPDEDTTYRLTVENNHGDTETCSVSIEVDEN